MFLKAYPAIMPLIIPACRNSLGYAKKSVVGLFSQSSLVICAGCRYGLTRMRRIKLF